jgi:hypothetical protein
MRGILYLLTGSSCNEFLGPVYPPLHLVLVYPVVGSTPDRLKFAYSVWALQRLVGLYMDEGDCLLFICIFYFIVCGLCVLVGGGHLLGVLHLCENTGNGMGEGLDDWRTVDFLFSFILF